VNFQRVAHSVLTEDAELDEASVIRGDRMASRRNARLTPTASAARKWPLCTRRSFLQAVIVGLEPRRSCVCRRRPRSGD